jgi:hypothetical protein
MPSPSPTERRTKWAQPLTALTAVVASLFRLIPHPPNCTPVGALGLFAGGRLPGWLALPLPLAVMGATDYLLFAWFGLPPYNRWVYASFLVYVLLGRWLARTNSPWRIGAASVLGSLQFFLITNFGVWYGSLGLPSAMYPPTTAGLLECYAMGLPFLGYTLLGDLSFSAALFGAHAWLAGAAAEPQAAAEEVRA